jgi:hypothetical protein
LSAAVPAIPMKVIGPFLTRPRVLRAEDLESLPYVVAMPDEHIVGGTGTRVYVRAIPPGGPQAYTVFRAGPPYQDPDTGAVLGQESAFIADAQLEQAGDPATLMLARAEKEVRTGDRLLPAEIEPVRIAFQPHAPKTRIRGHIISVLDGVTQIGQYSVVALDRGAAEGIEPGQVLEIWQTGRPIRDIVQGGFGETIVPPEQRSGLLMVFRVFDHVSYALVMNATRFIHILDAVQTP